MRLLNAAIGGAILLTLAVLLSGWPTLAADKGIIKHDAIVNFEDGCTGFHIGDGLIVTAGHCAIGASTKAFYFRDGQRGGATVALSSNPLTGFEDFAVFRASNAEAINAVHLDCGATIIEGMAVRMTGYPGVSKKEGSDGFGRATVWGRVAASEILPSDPWWRKPVLRVNISSMGGFSGSPVFSERSNKVIGILVGSMNDNHSLAFVQPLAPVCAMLGR